MLNAIINVAVVVVAFKAVVVFSLAMVGVCYMVNRAFYYANSTI